MRLELNRSPCWDGRWQWVWVFLNAETLNLSILLTINRFSIWMIVPWLAVVDKNSKFIKNEWFLKNGFPHRNWSTQVVHNKQYMYDVGFKDILHISNGYSCYVLTFICIFVDKNTQKSWIHLQNPSDRPKIVNLHTSSMRPFWALTDPLTMSLGVSESWDIEFIDIVDNKYNFFQDYISMVDCCWQKLKTSENT